MGYLGILRWLWGTSIEAQLYLKVLRNLGHDFSSCLGLVVTETFKLSSGSVPTQANMEEQFALFKKILNLNPQPNVLWRLGDLDSAALKIPCHVQGV